MDDMEFSSDRSVEVIERTKSSKRQRRPSSPLSAPAFTIATIIFSYTSGGGCGSGSNCFSDDHLSPSISTDCTTEVEEEIVDCLLLLAKGISPINELRKAVHQSTNNFSGRKIIEMATAEVAAAKSKVGYVVYECKTCYRTFPSFQALGGHSASHKRPKLEQACLVPLPSLINANEEDTKFILSPLPLQMIPASKGKAKVHECSICGRDFMSGQALGGHVTRHRATKQAASNPCSFFLPSIQIDNSTNSTEDVIENLSNRLVFDLRACTVTRARARTRVRAGQEIYLAVIEAQKGLG